MSKTFRFRGSVGHSKSMLNRFQILKSYNPKIEILGDSAAEDVVKMRGALQSMLANEHIECGSAGTVLRFVAVRASRFPGRHNLVGERRLFERPQTGLMNMLTRLGCRVKSGAGRERGLMVIDSAGWKIPAKVAVEQDVSSQFASALLLNAWNLDQDLVMELTGEQVSHSYLRMTMEIMRRAGLDFEESNSGIFVPARQKLEALTVKAEIDVSSAFAVCALAAASCGSAEIENWPRKSLQPDAAFPKILNDMGCDVRRIEGGNTLHISRSDANPLSAIDCDLRDMPDLFPVLAVLCALADGVSNLKGAPQLKHKESHRIVRTSELIKMIGASVIEKEDGLEIKGISGSRFAAAQAGGGIFDPDHDHRLAMAAAVARLATGADIDIINQGVVDKSFPEFWDVLDEGQR